MPQAGTAPRGNFTPDLQLGALRHTGGWPRALSLQLPTNILGPTCPHTLASSHHPSPLSTPTSPVWPHEQTQASRPTVPLREPHSWLCPLVGGGGWALAEEPYSLKHIPPHFLATASSKPQTPSPQLLQKSGHSATFSQ